MNALLRESPHSDASRLCLLRNAEIDLPPATLADLFRDHSRRVSVRRGEVVVLHGEPVDNIYQVVAGIVRCCTITGDGRRQIFHFARAGEFLGFVDIDSWHFTAEAVDHVILRALPRSHLDEALEHSAPLRRHVRDLMARTIARRERQLLDIAYLQADERLLGFLRSFSEGRPTNAFLPMPMTRLDIADHLGLSLETVSRTFGQLKRKGLIEMRGHDRFRLLDGLDSRLREAPASAA